MSYSVWSEIESGSGERDDTPLARIPRSIPPPSCGGHTIELWKLGSILCLILSLEIFRVMVPRCLGVNIAIDKAITNKYLFPHHYDHEKEPTNVL